MIVNSNLIPVEEIRAKAEPEIKKRKILHFVTVGRVDYQKAYDRLLNILEKLYDKGYRFEWKIIGGGDDFDRINQRLMNSRVKACVEMLGTLSNPFPFVKEADVFALLSNFEGRPNTIYEAFVLGTPVIATDVGCVSEMVIPGENGWLVDNDDKAILKMLEHIMDEPNEVERIKEKISNYEYDNETVMKTTYETLRFYIERPAEREALRKRCVEMAQDTFSIERSASAMMDAAGDMFSFSPDKKRLVGLRMAQLSGIGHMTLVKWRTHGIRLLSVTMEKIVDSIQRMRSR